MQFRYYMTLVSEIVYSVCILHTPEKPLSNAHTMAHLPTHCLAHILFPQSTVTKVRHCWLVSGPPSIALASWLLHLSLLLGSLQPNPIIVTPNTRSSLRITLAVIHGQLTPHDIHSLG